MAGNVYSTYEMARRNACERMKELEQDIFVCRVRYPSGEEFVLKTRDEMRIGEFIYHLEIPFTFKFKNKHNAIREANVFEKKRGGCVMVDSVKYLQNGYKKHSHYKLCST